MATAPVVTPESLSESGYTSSQPESAALQAVRLVPGQLQRLAEYAAAIVDAPLATLVVLDLVRHAPVRVATYSRNRTPANLHVHEAIARLVMGHRVPLLSGDGASDPRVRTLGKKARGSWVSLPLQAGQEVMGALTIASPLINAFSPPDLRLLQTGADLGALAILQARHLGAMTQHTHHLTLLLELAQRLSTVSDARTIVGLTVWALGQLNLCEEAVLFRYYPDTETLWGVAGLGTRHSHLAEACIRVSDPQSVTAWVAQQRQPLLYTGEANGFISLATEVQLAQREMALLAVPLVVGERLLGVITLARTLSFATDDLGTMLTLSQLIAPALAQTR
jgi:transcriptional regulator with GAF, ATPase, and Fis domain